MWCYSLRFPRIRKIKMNQSFMECMTFKELQELGRNSISSVLPIEAAPADETYSSKSSQKRVRFVLEEPKQERMLKSEFFIYLSKKIKLAERESLTGWLEHLGFESSWSLAALKTYGIGRKLIYIHGDDEDNSLSYNFWIHYKSARNLIVIDGVYFCLKKNADSARV